MLGSVTSCSEMLQNGAPLEEEREELKA